LVHLVPAAGFVLTGAGGGFVPGGTGIFSPMRGIAPSMPIPLTTLLAGGTAITFALPVWRCSAGLALVFADCSARAAA
jgi:hypothetical protein